MIKKSDLIDLLACQRCVGDLRYESEELVCARFKERYPVKDGIPCFGDTDEFYDAFAEEHCPFHVSPSGLKGLVLKFLPFWSWREWQFWRRVIPPCNRLLDVGCGRGRQLFAERAKQTVGLDGSLRFMRDCAAHYNLGAVGQFPRLPFRSEIFDVVVSSHVLGHVSAIDKEGLVDEMVRTLRPGGLTAHIIETDSDHAAVRGAKEEPDIYKEQFIEQYGHIGLEPANLAIERFERRGLIVRKRLLVEAIVPSVLNYRMILGHSGFKNVPGLAWTRRFDHLTQASALANVAYEVGMGLFHRTVEQWLGRSCAPSTSWCFSKSLRLNAERET